MQQPTLKKLLDHVSTLYVGIDNKQEGLCIFGLQILNINGFECSLNAKRIR